MNFLPAISGGAALVIAELINVFKTPDAKENGARTNNKESEVFAKGQIKSENEATAKAIKIASVSLPRRTFSAPFPITRRMANY